MAAFRLIVVCVALHVGRAWAADPESAPQQHPRWRQTLRALGAKDHKTRRDAILWLARHPGKASTKALRKLLRHADARMRWLAIVALRGRTSKGLEEALWRALQDQDVRVRLNAAVSIGAYGGISRLLKLINYLQDPNPLVQSTICQILSKQASEPLIPTLRRCLYEFGSVTYSITVQTLEARQTKLSLALRRLLASAKPQTANGLRSFPNRRIDQTQGFPSLDALKRKLRSTDRLLQRYTRNLKARERFMKRYAQKPSSLKCVQNALRRFQAAVAEYKRLRKEYETFMKKDELGAARRALNDTLFSTVRARARYRIGMRCRYRYRYRRYVRYRRRDKWLTFDGLPQHGYSPAHNQLQVMLRFTHDNFYDALRDDLQPPYRPFDAEALKKNWDILFSTMLDFSFNLRFFRHWVFYASNRLAAHLRAKAPELGGIGDQLTLRLSYGRESKNFHRLFFVQERFTYSQNPPPDEAFPEYFSGPHLRNEARIGGALAWVTRQRGRKFRRFSLRGSYRNLLEQPFAHERNQRFWTTRMAHRGWLAARWAPNDALGFGVESSAEFFDFFSSSPQIPALHLNVMATASFRTRQRTLRLDLAGGLARVWPFFAADAPPDNPLVQQSEYLGPALSATLSGVLSRRRTRTGFRWRLGYKYRTGPSLRPFSAYFLAHEWEVQTSIGARGSRRFPFTSLGLNIQWLHFPGAHLQDATERPMREVLRIALHGYLELPFSRMVRARLGNRLMWLSNGLVDPNGGLQLRNIFYIELGFSVPKFW